MTQFKAAYYEITGKAKEVLKIGYFSSENPKENELQIEIITSGINPSDVKMRQGARTPLAFPYLIPHSDGAGIVRKIGTGISKFKVGDRVWIYNAAWQRNHGTASTFINIPQDLVVLLPENTSFEIGACLGVPAMTAAACLLAINCLHNALILDKEIVNM